MPRKPDPFTVCYAPDEWLRTAKLDGEPVDLIEAFQSWGWDKLSRIEVTANGRSFYPYRDGDLFENVPYKGEGAGYLSREELIEQYGINDAELEAKIAVKLHIRVELAGGEDTPEKRYLRASGFDALRNKLSEPD